MLLRKSLSPGPCRDTRQTWLDSLWQDSRYAARSIGCQPWAFMVAVSMLGLAIGITSAMFAIVDALILRPVPFKDPDRLAHIYMGSEHGGPTTVAPAVFRAWKSCPAFAAAEAARSDTALIAIDGGVALRGIARVTPGVFDLLGGIRPVRGRLFDASEGRPGSDDRVLLSEDVWRALCHSDPALVGRSIMVDGRPMVVVGILPSEFRFPSWNTVIWRAASFEDERPVVYVRFAPKVPSADALRMATTAAREADARNARLWAQPRPLAGLVLDEYYQRAVPLLSGGVVLLFLVLCANVSSLLLGGLLARAREFATRSALGAPRSRLVRQAFLESAGVGTGGLVAGIGIGWALVSVSRAFLPEVFLMRSLNPLNIDLRALGVTSIAGVVATLAAGLLPAFIGTRIDISRSLRLAVRSGTGTTGARNATRALVVSQIALSCTLLLGATLLVRSFANLMTADRGLDTRQIMVAMVEMPSASFPTEASRATAARALEEQARALPGVRYATWSYGVPPGGGAISFGDWVSDAPGANPVHLEINRFFIGSDFFSLYGIPILRGRSFQASDAPGAVLVGERFAHALWPGMDPVGRSFSFEKAQFHVVGLVREIHYPSLDRKLDRPQIYQPFGGVSSLAMLSLRCGGNCPDTALVWQRLAAAQLGVQVVEAGALENAYFRELARPRAAAALAFAFAATALIAAAAGLFSLLSYGVTRRRHEFGIRAAIGASPADIRRLVLRDGLAVALTGIGIGTFTGLSLARVVASLQYDVTMTDPLSCAIVISMLALAIAGASWRPTQEAVRTDPALLLREE